MSNLLPGAIYCCHVLTFLDEAGYGWCFQARPTMDALRSHSLLAAASSMAWGAGILGAQSLRDARKSKTIKALPSDPEPLKQHQVRSAARGCGLTCSRGRSPGRRSPPRRSRWWSELLLWDFCSSTWWERWSSSPTKLMWAKGGGLTLCGWPQGGDCTLLHQCLVGGTGTKTTTVTPQRERTQYCHLVEILFLVFYLKWLFNWTDYWINTGSLVGRTGGLHQS